MNRFAHLPIKYTLLKTTATTLSLPYYYITHPTYYEVVLVHLIQSVAIQTEISRIASSVDLIDFETNIKPTSTPVSTVSEAIVSQIIV